MSNYYIGLMSGTSLDGLDAALVDLSVPPGKILTSICIDFDDAYRQQVNQLIAQPDWTIYGAVNAQYARYAIDAIEQLLATAQLPSSAIQGIGSHGQTIWHQPEGQNAFSLQIGDPNRIAAETGIPVVADLRNKDIALGGQGAPLVPAFHQWAFADQTQTVVVANIGGIANITVLSPAQPVLGFDTGPGNGLMNLWAQQHFNQNYDSAGQIAASGACIQPLLDAMLADDYFAKPPPKSTGREYFNASWLKPYNLSEYAPTDVLCTLTHLTALTLADSIKLYQPERLLVCGGGAHNHYLMQQLAEYCGGGSITATTAVGMHPDWAEAVAFAWLAQQKIQGRPGNLKSVTGAKDTSVLGALYH